MSTQTFVLIKSTGEGDEYSRETLYAGQDYAAAKQALSTNMQIESLQVLSDCRWDVEIWQNGQCIEVEEYANEEPETQNNECSNCNEYSIEPHTCPFKVEINDDSETLCSCCESCTHECAMEI